MKLNFVSCEEVIRELKLEPIVLPIDIDNMCRRFGEETDVSEWQKRGQLMEHILRNNATGGRRAEWGWKELFERLGFECSEPDMKHYTVNQKSFSSDLIVNKVHKVHVKSTDLTSPSGATWTFQTKDIKMLVREHRPYEHIAFTIVDGRNVYCIECVPIRYVKERHIKRMYNESYNSNKSAIYYEDVREMIKRMEGNVECLSSKLS